MSETSPKSSGSFVVTLLASLGGLAIFLLILLAAYLPHRVPPAGDGVRTPEQRKAILAEQRGKEKTALTTYGWVDQPKGIVRLPVARAKELVIQEYAR